ncbi:MAG: class I SAM-dependent methyltransferase [Bdellovibrionales bacterium]|nr:class I SAM-dependent methyltransferase [Bdellovibrionales bacterium]
MITSEKAQVKNFWENASCGEKLYLHGLTKEDFNKQLQDRYRLEPYILRFADFDKWRNKKVLEIGVGLGADHQRFAEAGAELYGIDLTDRAIERVKNRFQKMGLKSHLSTGDAEALDFPDNTFDLVYSWGVIHHSPDTPKAVQEILRVLKPAGQFKVMIYNYHSLVGYMLWIRYALLNLRFFVPLNKIYDKYLESPGTKAYRLEEAKKLFSEAKDVKIRRVMTHADLLESHVGQRHRGRALSFAKKIWPRWLLKRLLPEHGLFMLIEGRKLE